jgi:hypothetical protein
MADRDDLTDSFLALVDKAFGRLLDEPDDGAEGLVGGLRRALLH